MQLQSVLYISTSTVPVPMIDREVERILAASMRNNLANELTGALMFTGTHFAQVLEGSASDVDDILQIVTRDPRHHDVIVVDRSPIIERRFADWQMAYSGPSRFVSGFVSRVLAAAPGENNTQASALLTELMVQFNRAR